MSDNQSYLHEVREALLAEVLTLAAFEGWTLQVLAAAARNLNIEPAKAKLAFPKGKEDLLAYASHHADDEMQAALEAHDLASLKIREKITLAVRLRLEVMLRDKDSAARAVHTLALPHNAPLAAKLTYDTVDAIWRAIGDTSSDFNFYTKRATLAGVYSTTLMRFFGDDSEDHANTWAFLDRRIANVMQFEKVKAKVRKASADWRSPWEVLSGLRYPRTRR